MTIDFKKIQIDEELEDLLPRLLEDDHNSLTQSLIENGFDQKFGRIKVWFPEDNDGTGYIVDGHNRYKICRKNGIELSDYCFEPVFFDSKDQVIKWMFENQLARRNLSSIQRIAVVEKYRPIYERQALTNKQAAMQEARKSNQKNKTEQISVNLPKTEPINTSEKLANIAGVSEKTYRMGAKVLNSGNDDLKQRVLSGETSISAGYRELRSNSKENPAPKKEETVTPEQRIIEADNRMNEIDREISSLRTERETLMRKRSMMFEALDIECELKYEFVIDKDGFRDYQFYIECNGHKNIFVTCCVLFDETPNNLFIDKIPEKYKNDFIMLWKKAHEEDLQYRKEIEEENRKKWQKNYSDAFTKAFGMPAKNEFDDKTKNYLKRFYKVLAVKFHPDVLEGDNGPMQLVNKLKEQRGI